MSRPAYSLLLLLSALPAQAASLADAVSAAWLRSPQGRIAEARLHEVHSRQDAATAALPGPPVLDMGWRSDRWTGGSRTDEQEIGLAVPLWQPGQQSAQQTLAQAEAALLQAEQERERLQLAGEVRERFWAAVAAGQAETLASSRVTAASRLHAEVERRVRAGDLASLDLHAAEAERLAAVAAHDEARQRAQLARRQLTLLTGQAALPPAVEEPVHAVFDREHPRLTAARVAVERAQAVVASVRHSRRQAPELGVQWVREVEADDDRHSVRLQVRLPLGDDATAAPELARALRELAEAEAERAQVADALASERQTTQDALQAAERAVEFADARHAVLQRSLDLTRKAFALGEMSLAQVLRIQAQADEAELLHAQAYTSRALARARFNQMQGVLP